MTELGKNNPITGLDRP